MHKLNFLQLEMALVRQLADARDVPEAIEALYRFVNGRWAFDAITLHLLDPKRRCLISHGSYGAPTERADAPHGEPIPLTNSTSVPARVAISQQANYQRAAQQGQPASTADTTECLTLPLIDNGETIGVVQLFSKARKAALSTAAIADVDLWLRRVSCLIQNGRHREPPERQQRAHRFLVEQLRAINSTIELPALLEMLASALRELESIDGFVIDLPDQSGTYLVSRQVVLPPGFEGIATAYVGWKSLVDSNSKGRCYQTRRRLMVDSALLAADPDLRVQWERWQLRFAALLPIAHAQESIGVAMLLSQRGEIPADALERAEVLLELFAPQIRNALSYSYLRLQKEAIDVAAAQQQHLLSFISDVNQLTSIDSIYDQISERLLRDSPFDLCNIFMREGETLIVKCSHLVNPRHADAHREYQSYIAANPYPLTLDSGRPATIFLKNIPSLIPDTQRVMHLPMAEIDHTALQLINGYRTCVFMPVRHHGEAIGLLQLISLDEPVPFTEAAMQTLEAICSLIGTGIVNAQLYSTVEQQKENIRGAQAQLVDVERRRAEAAAQARDLAEAATRQKSAFLANMSHEIRTPLTAIIGYGESLLDASLTAHEREQFAATITRNGRHLLDLLNDILDLSKLEAGKLQLECVPVPLAPLIEDMRALFEPRARDKGLELRLRADTPLPRDIVSDATRLRQILINLLGNALKFTEHGHVSVEAHWDEAHHELSFAVCDTGIGMSPAHLERIFEAFTQADASTSRRFGGTGLGLSISHQIALLLGGGIRVSSQEGMGSRFELWLRIEAPVREWIDLAETLAAGPAIAPTLEPAPQLRGRILFADDNPDNQALIGRLIRQTGAEVAIAGDGRAAVDIALREPFDLVLLDIQMPILDGLGAVTELRAQHYAQPVVALTANVLPEDLRRYRIGGFDAHLAKPIVRRALYETLALYLEAGRDPTPAEPAQADLALIDELSELVPLFVEHLAMHLQDMRLAAAAEDWRTLDGLAHQIKGSGSSFGFPGLTEQARGFCEAVRSEDPLALEPAWRRLEAEMQATLGTHALRAG